MNKVKEKSDQSPNAAKQTKNGGSSKPREPALPMLLLATLGVVYGDLGTSPIYSLRACFSGYNPLPITDVNILGILSLIFWTLIVVISTKYLVFVLRADNHGEGGIFALFALLRPNRKQLPWRRYVLIMVGLFGASMLYAGVMITPAISVMSAVEGLQLVAPAFSSYVVPATVIILFLLFAFQSRGTAMVGSVFGPLMLVWFGVIAALGVYGIVQAPRVLAAVNPWHAVVFFERNRLTGFLVLYAVFLVTTGGEALYADLGHFGQRPIRLGWFGFVLPAVLINYFGQGARLLVQHADHVQPFFHLAPDWALLPVVILATLATCIASQAAISGAFSLTRQAVQLGQVPPLRVEQTSAEARGQVYMPAVNWMLMIATIGLTIGFGSSTNIAAAYGISVNSTMVVTTILAFNVARERGGWSIWAA
jgi:KUP system potassium uptake protein